VQHFLLYIDPGSGSLFLQILAGGLLATGMFVKTYWLKIKSFFRKGDKNDQ
jgi:hypothetical protein